MNPSNLTVVCKIYDIEPNERMMKMSALKDDVHINTKASEAE